MDMFSTFVVVALGWYITRAFYMFVQPPSSTSYYFAPTGTITVRSNELVFILSGLVGIIGAVGVFGVTTKCISLPPHVFGIIIFFTGLAGLVGGMIMDSFLRKLIFSSIAQGKVGELTKWFLHGTAEERCEAAGVFASMVSNRSFVNEFMPQLLKALRATKDANARFHLACAVRAAGAPNRTQLHEIVDTLRPMLYDPEVKVRAPVALTLHELGAATLPDIVRPLASALMSDDKAAWGMVTYFLDRPGTYTHLAIPDIFQAVVKHNCDMGALGLCFRWIDPAGRAALEEGSRHQNQFVRALAQKGLASLSGNLRT